MTVTYLMCAKDGAAYASGRGVSFAFFCGMSLGCTWMLLALLALDPPTSAANCCWRIAVVGGYGGCSGLTFRWRSGTGAGCGSAQRSPTGGQGGAGTTGKGFCTGRARVLGAVPKIEDNVQRARVLGARKALLKLSTELDDGAEGSGASSGCTLGGLTSSGCTSSGCAGGLGGEALRLAEDSGASSGAAALAAAA